MDIEDITGINPGEEPEQSSASNLPAGQYLVEIVDWDLRETKSGTGKGIEVNFKVLGPQFRDWNLSNWYNLEHQNSQAQEIGREQFGDLLLALGFDAYPDSFDELVGHTCFVETSNREEHSEEYGKTVFTDITGVSPASGEPDGPYEDGDSGASGVEDTSFDEDEIPF